MGIREAVKILEQHNKWRRSKNIPNDQEMQHPTKIGEAIDTLCNYHKPFEDVFEALEKDEVIKTLNERLQELVSTMTSVYIVTDKSNKIAERMEVELNPLIQSILKTIEDRKEVILGSFGYTINR